MQTHVSHTFVFNQGGDARRIQVSGWSGAELEHTWAEGKHSVVSIPEIEAPHGFFIEIDWQPFASFPYRPDQGVSITVNDQKIGLYRLAEREVSAFYCPPMPGLDKGAVIGFEHPDACKVADYVDTTDPRELAIAFRRLRILPLAEPFPGRLRNTSALQASLRDGLISIPDAHGPKTVEPASLLGRFEMLAGNCDLGLAMRDLGVERLSLLRFAAATSEVAIRGLESDFQGLGENLSAEIANNLIKEWMVRDSFGLRFHTDQSSTVMSEAEILRRQRIHIQFLRRKFLEDFESGEKIFVYADHLRPRTYESALALFLSLNRHGPRRMLWVCPNFGEVTPGRVDEIVPGFARGSFNPLDGPLLAGHIAMTGWVNVLLNAAVVLDKYMQ